MAGVNITQDMVGTEVKLNINVEPMCGMTMDDYDFECMFYCVVGMRERLKYNVRLKKEDMIRIDANNYMVVVDSSVTGAGELAGKMIAFLPDADCDDNVRKDIVPFSTDGRVKRGGECFQVRCSRVCSVKKVVTGEIRYFLELENGGPLLLSDGRPLELRFGKNNI